MILPYKKLFKVLLSLSLITCPTFTLADAGDNAIKTVQEAVDNSYLAAKADAQAYVKMDFLKLVDNISNELVRYASNKEYYKDHTAFVSLVEDKFRELANKDLITLPKTRKQLEQFISNYEELVRTKFELSWHANQQQKDFEDARDFILAFSKDFENVCKAGRANGDSHYMPPGLVTPPFVSSFKGYVNPSFVGALTSGVPFTVGHSYVSSTGGSEAANRDRARTVAVTTTISNISANFWVASKLTGAAAGSGAFSGFSTAMAAAAPYALVASAVVIVVVDLMAREEAYKLSAKITKANDIRREETANAIDVNKYYKESCLKYSDALKKIANVFIVLTSKDKALAVKNAERQEAEIESWEKKSVKKTIAFCKSQLQLLIKHNGCVDVSTINGNLEKYMEDNKNDPTKLCYINKEKTQITPISGDCSLPYNDEKRQTQVESAHKLIEDYDKVYDFEKTIELISAKMTLVLSEHEEMQKTIRETSFYAVNRQQERAFQNLIRFINLSKKARRVSNSSSMIIREKKIQAKYYDFRKSYFRYVGHTLDVIFGNANKEDVLKEMGQIHSELRPFYKKYFDIKEVRTLYENFVGLARDIRSF